MSIWNQGYYFEPAGERYVYRPTVFSRGYDVSKDEKDRLFRELKRLEWRSFREAFLAVTLVAILFLTGVIHGETVVLWFVLIGSLAVIALAATSTARKKQLISRVMGDRNPDVPRLPLTTAVSAHRPLVAKRYSLPVVRGAVIVTSLCLVIVNALAFYSLFAAYQAGQFADGPDYAMSVEALLAAIVYSVDYWMLVALMNASLMAFVLILVIHLRRLRRLPDFD